MEELELFLASLQIDKAAILVGDCGPERLEELFRYVNLKQCCVVCPWPARDMEILEERIRNDAARGLFSLPEELVFLPYYRFGGMEGVWAFCPIRCKGADLLPILNYAPQYLADRKSVV